MNFPNFHRQEHPNYGYSSKYYNAQEVEVWRLNHTANLANPQKLLSITLEELIILNDLLRERIEEC